MRLQATNAIACLMAGAVAAWSFVGEAEARAPGSEAVDCGSTVSLHLPTAEIETAHWDGVILAVGSANAVHQGFFTSMAYWSGGFRKDGEVVFDGIEAGQHEVAASSGSVQVLGDCNGTLEVPPGGMVHIRGDLSGRLVVSGHAEVVLGGNLTSGARIEGDGITRILIAGDADGTIAVSSGTEIWALGNFNGEIRTGHPSTRVFVFGDFKGSIQPTTRASLLYLVVHGFMAYEHLEATDEHGYTEFLAVLGSSDRKPGIWRRFGEKAGSWTVLAEPETTR